jgi:hypothetical protein
MPKCSCAGSACSCNITVGDGLVVSGTGNANSPFTISLASQSIPIDVAASGPIDVSGAQSGTVIYISASANVTGLTLPTTVGSRLDVIVRHVVANTTVAFPPAIIWAGGGDPTQTATAGRTDWYTLRYVGDFWIGAMTAINAY